MSGTTKIDIRFERRTILRDSTALRDYAVPRLMHACSHGKVLSLKLTCRICEHGMHAVDALVVMPKRHVECITIESTDMYKSIDLLVPKLEAMVRHQKSRIQNLKHESICRPIDRMVKH